MATSKRCLICGNWIVGDSEERHRCNTAGLLNVNRDEDCEPDDEERLALGSALLEASERDEDRYADDDDEYADDDD